MKETSVINIGSNSVKLLDLTSGGLGFRETISCRLQAGKKDGALAPASILRTADAVCRLIKLANERGLNPDIYATEALRSASNGGDLAAIVYDQTKKNIRIIDGEKEGLLAFFGAASAFGDVSAVIDVGGASTEISDGKKAASFPIGAVKLSEQNVGFLDMLDTARKALSGCDFSAGALAVGVGGTFTAITAIIHRVNERDREGIHGRIIEKEKLESLAKEIACIPSREILERFPYIDSDRAEIIGAGLAIAVAAMEKIGATKVTVSSTDGLHGYLFAANNSLLN